MFAIVIFVAIFLLTLTILCIHLVDLIIVHTSSFYSDDSIFCYLVHFISILSCTPAIQMLHLLIDLLSLVIFVIKNQYAFMLCGIDNDSIIRFLSVFFCFESFVISFNLSFTCLKFG